MNRKTGILILAAGSSSRLGSPKQLVKIEGKTLIRRVAETALSLDPEKVILVTGAYSDAVEAEIDNLPVLALHNQEWQNGMASSIHKGLTYLATNNYDAAVILVCDQVNITSALLHNIIDAWLTQGSRLVCCVYGEEVGTPALFDKSLFSELFNLSGDRGAKAVILKHINEAAEVAFPGGLIDIDTPDDLKNLTD